MGFHTFWIFIFKSIALCSGHYTCPITEVPTFCIKFWINGESVFSSCQGQKESSAVFEVFTEMSLTIQNLKGPNIPPPAPRPHAIADLWLRHWPDGCYRLLLWVLATHLIFWCLVENFSNFPLEIVVMLIPPQDLYFRFVTLCHLADTSRNASLLHVK